MNQQLLIKHLRGAVGAVVLACLCSTPLHTHALMAGAAPDTPDARIDRRGTESPYAGVGSISIERRTFTGTLISPRHVLTAAHVVSGIAPAAITFNLISHGAISRQVAVATVHMHPAYSGFEPGRPAEADLAIIELAEPVPSVYPIYPLLRQVIPVGTPLVLAGFGGSGPGDLGERVAADPAMRRTGVNTLDQIHAARSGRAHAAYWFDFDGPDQESNRFGGRSLGNSYETSLASGDSGSPAFVRDRQGRLWLVGVNSFRFGLHSSFGNGGGGQLISAYADWIDGIVAARLHAHRQ